MQEVIFYKLDLPKKRLEVSKQPAILKSRRRNSIEMRRFVNGTILCQKDWHSALG